MLSGLARELREETGLRVVVERLVGIYSDPTYQVVNYPGGEAVHFVTSLFVCRQVGGTLTGSDEGTEWVWFPADALPGDLLPYAAVWLRDAMTPASEVRIR